MNVKAYLAPLMALLLTGSQPKWSRFVSRSEGFEVAMPGRPVQQEVTVRSATGPTRVDFWTLDLKNGPSYGVSASDLTAINGRLAPPQIILSGARDGALRKIHGSLLSERNVSLDGFPGREVRARVSGGVYESRVFLVRQRLFQIIVAGPKARMPAGDTRKFLDSFRLLIR